MDDWPWITLAKQKLGAQDTGGVLAACMPEVMSAMTMSTGFLIEVQKAGEAIDKTRLERAVDGLRPHFSIIFAGLSLSTAALVSAGRCSVTARESFDHAAVEAVLAVDLKVRGAKGTVLYHCRVAQAESLQALKFFSLLEQTHERRTASAEAWAAFEETIPLVADELRSIMFSFIVLRTLLDVVK